MKKGGVAKFFTILVFLVLFYVFFTSLFSLGGFFGITVQAQLHVADGALVEVGNGYGEDVRFFAPEQVVEKTGGDWVATYRLPAGGDGVYRFDFGTNTGKIRLGTVTVSTVFCRRVFEYDELADYFSGYSGLVCANGFVTVENAPENMVLQFSEPAQSLPVQMGRFVLLLGASALLALLFTVGTKKVLSLAGNNLLGPAGLVFGYLFAAAMAAFVFISLANGFPSLIFDAGSVRKEKEPATEVPETTAEMTEPVEAPFDETAPQPLKKEEPADSLAEWNIPKVPLEALTEGAVWEGVLTGKKDQTGQQWFFWNESLEDFNGVNLFTAQQLERGAKNLKAYRDWLAEQGASLYVVLCPDKAAVYPEYLPEGYTPAAQTRSDQFLAYVRESYPDIALIDVRSALLAGKTENFPLYYRLDTHWNNFGGFAAYREIMARIAADFPTVRVLQQQDYRVDFFDSYMKDQAWYLGYYDFFTEQGPVFTPLEKTGTELVQIRKSGQGGIFDHAYTQENGYHDYNTYLEYRNQTIPEAPSLYMLRDSFGISLSQFLKDGFSRSVFKWSTTYEKADILAQKPDIVILEVVERELGALVKQNFR